jgi:hypothetical protein
MTNIDLHITAYSIIISLFILFNSIIGKPWDLIVALICLQFPLLISVSDRLKIDKLPMRIAFLHVGINESIIFVIIVCSWLIKWHVIRVI